MCEPIILKCFFSKFFIVINLIYFFCEEYQHMKSFLQNRDECYNFKTAYKLCCGIESKEKYSDNFFRKKLEPSQRKSNQRL